MIVASRIVMVVALVYGIGITFVCEAIASGQRQGATIIGTVTFEGAVPPVNAIDVVNDRDVCGETVLVQTVQVDPKTHGLQQAVVSIEGMTVPDNTKKEGRPPHVMVNLECSFSPRVNTAMKGYKLEIQNRDSILHNTHIKVGRRTLVNVAQLPNSRPIIKRIKRPGLHTIRCDKHKFMSGALMVFEHPYFSTTNEAGTFQMKNVPAGHRTIHVWHETLGDLTQSVLIPSEGAVTVRFTYP